MGKVLMPSVGGSADFDVVTAVASDILHGKIAIGSDGEQLTGTMTNRGAWTSSPSSSGKVTIPSGYHNGSGYVNTSGVYNSGYNSGYNTGYSEGESNSNKNSLLFVTIRNNPYDTSTKYKYPRGSSALTSDYYFADNVIIGNDIVVDNSDSVRRFYVKKAGKYKFYVVPYWEGSSASNGHFEIVKETSNGGTTTTTVALTYTIKADYGFVEKTLDLETTDRLYCQTYKSGGSSRIHIAFIMIPVD